jgi:hypothetical protein
MSEPKKIRTTSDGCVNEHDVIYLFVEETEGNVSSSKLIRSDHPHHGSSGRPW